MCFWLDAPIKSEEVQATDIGRTIRALEKHIRKMEPARELYELNYSPLVSSQFIPYQGFTPIYSKLKNASVACSLMWVLNQIVLRKLSYLCGSLICCCNYFVLRLFQWSENTHQPRHTRNWDRADWKTVRMWTDEFEHSVLRMPK